VIFVAVLLELLQLVLSVGGAALSRRHEREADRFALDTTGRGDLLASGLKRLSKDNLSNLTPHPFYVWLNYSHPPTLERVKALEAAAPPAASG
jgi:STE24 endopeptidase